MTFVWAVGALIGALIVIHLSRPRYEPRRISAARFFADLPSPEVERRWRPGNPFRSYPFYLQLLFLALLLAAFWLTFIGFVTREGETRQAIGLWLLLDTSASMSAVQNGAMRLERALEATNEAIASAVLAAEESDICFRLSTFDLARRDLHTQADPMAISTLLAGIEVRPLGTDVGLIRTAVSEIIADEENGVAATGCPVTHLLVITDLPAPDWLVDIDAVPVIWRDISLPVANVGFSDIRAIRDPLTGLVNSVFVEVTAYGSPPASVEVVVEGPDGRQFLNETITNWGGAQIWRGTFTPEGGGAYHLRLNPGGSYAYDDQAVVFVEEIEQMRVDWRMNDAIIPTLLNWQIAPNAAGLRVVPYGTAVEGTIPTLFVGDSYGRLASEPTMIWDFEENSPLLTDVNLDVAEQLGLPGVPLPAGFTPVLRGGENVVWLAQRSDPPAAYVPGLPVFSDDNLGRFSALVFFNAVQWLLQQQPPQPLYTLTTPDEPEVGNGRLPLHPGEGNTATAPLSWGELSDLEPVSTRAIEEPIWPILLVLAATSFFIERGLSAYGSSKWQ